jgi:predicted nuclease of predicted toxin-antitoxin system
LRFLIDRCAGRRLAQWLREQGHDVVEVKALGRDLGDEALLRQTADQKRILATIDSDFGTLIHLRAQAHAGLIRLPDVPPTSRIELMAQMSFRTPSSRSRAAAYAYRASRLCCVWQQFHDRWLHNRSGEETDERREGRQW